MKWVRRVLIGAAAAVILLAAVSLTVLISISGDDPAPDDSDLRLPRLNLPEDENAFTWFDKAVGALERGADVEGIYEALASEEEGAEDEAEYLLDDNGDALALVAKGMTCARLEVPPVNDMTVRMPYLAQWQKISRLKALRSLLLARQGRAEEALEEAVDVVRFGRKIQGGRGAFLVFLTGCVVRESGLEALRNALYECEPDGAVLARCEADVAALNLDAQDHANSLRVEYVAMANTLDALAKGELREMVHVPAPLALSNYTCFYKPNMTKAILADSIRAIIDGKEPVFSTSATDPKLNPHTYHNRRKLVLSGNFIGISCLGMMLPGLSQAVLVEPRDSCSIGATRLLIAIKRHRMETGALPEKLDALVPGWLDAVPRDAFDGKPLRYDPERRVVYSVFRNLTDDGGIMPSDLVFRIEKEREEE